MDNLFSLRKQVNNREGAEDQEGFVSGVNDEVPYVLTPVDGSIF